MYPSSLGCLTPRELFIGLFGGGVGGGGSVGKGLLVGQTGYNQTLVYGHLISMDSFYGHFSVIINGV